MRRNLIWLALTLVLTGMAFYYQFNFAAGGEGQHDGGPRLGGAAAAAQEAEQTPRPGEEK